jgi:hypothetical protein
MNSLANSILSRKAVHGSAVEPHAVFNCKKKLRRATSMPRRPPPQPPHADSPNFFWSLSKSDPYQGYTYDVLYSDDLGKWGKYLWPVLLEALEERGYKGRLTMKYVPRLSVYMRV